MSAHGRSYGEAKAKVDRTREYTPHEAVRLVKDVKRAKFDKTVEESKAGKVEYRTDRTAIVHMTVGKTSFPDDHLLENYQAIVEELIRAKPSAAKGRYIRSVVMASTMGPGVKVDPSRTRDLIETEAVP